MPFSNAYVSSERLIMNELQELISLVAVRCPRKQLPDSYLVVDVETNGFYHTPRPGQEQHVIVQLGCAVVQERRMVDNMALFIKRPAGTMKGEAERVTGITDKILATQGVDPNDAYPQFLALFQLFRDSGCMFMGHNMVSFDAPFIHTDFTQQGYPFQFRPGEYIDTGMMFKAAQMRTVPSPIEDLHKFFMRIGNTHSRVKWNLTGAVRSLNVDKKHGLDMDKAHDAGFDCKATHLLFEELRLLTETV